MTKKLNLSFILLFCVATVVVAWKTLQTFFGGVGLNFVGLVALIIALTVIILTDKHSFNRIKEMYFIGCGLAALELIVYFAFEFIVKSYNHVAGFMVYQNILSFIGLLYVAYIAFRFITEYKDIKIGFVEFILGNKKITKQPKKAKELTNGTLEEKPNNKEHSTFNSYSTDFTMQKPKVEEVVPEQTSYSFNNNIEGEETDTEKSNLSETEEE